MSQKRNTPKFNTKIREETQVGDSLEEECACVDSFLPCVDGTKLHRLFCFIKMLDVLEAETYDIELNKAQYKRLTSFIDVLKDESEALYDTITAGS